jgi:hypothetical protein
MNLVEGWSRLRVGSSALEFVKGRLGIGTQLRPGLPLRRALSELLLDQGELWTWGPKEAHIQLGDLESGLPDGISQKGQRQMLAHFSEQYLENHGRILILEDHDASPADAFLNSKSARCPWIGLAEYLYWYATEPKQVQPVLECGLGLNNCLALSKGGSSWSTVKPSLLTRDEINELARRTDHFVVDAFDSEGFLVWSRSYYE